MPHLLVVDDEPSVSDALERCLRKPDFEVTTCASARDAVHFVDQRPPDIVIMDVCLPDGSGLEAYDQIRAKLPRLPVIIVTGHAATETAVEAMKRGAFDYIVKPVDLERLRGVVNRAAEISQLARSGDRPLPEGAWMAATLIGRSPAMQEVYKSIGRVASQEVTVLLLGESGTGKELVAGAIARYSARSEKPFVVINCAAIPEAQLESELFGHEKGALSGAQERRIGKFESAHGGTVFLDEIADMSAATQAKVLRLMQEQQFERIGGTQTVKTNVRVIAATSKAIGQLVADGSFRQDLYDRVNGFTIELPPLRERQGDIPLLTNFFIQRFNREMGKTVQAVSDHAMRWLEAHPWPGNVREMQCTIKHAMLKVAGDVLTRECFPTVSLASDAAPLTASAPPNELPKVVNLTRSMLNSRPGAAYRHLSMALDSVIIQEALRHTNGNQLNAAALLGISRTTLRAKMRSLGVTVAKQLSVDDKPA